jgi:pimeloyl-ACP methyl ester carboxylesterase
MTTVIPEVTRVISARFNFAFSQNGRYSVCLRTVGEDLAIEHWTLTAKEACSRTIPEIVVDRGAHALPLDDGRIILFQSDLPSTFGQSRLTLLEPRKGDLSLQRLGEIPAPLGGYLLPSPSSTQLGFVITLDDAEHSTVWRLSASPSLIEPIAQVSGLLSGGVWLDDDASVLAVNKTHSSGGSSGIVIDLLQGSWKRIWSVSDMSTERIVLYSLHSKLCIVTTNAFGEERIGWGRLGAGTVTVHFTKALHRPGYMRKALALDDCGERLLVHEVAAAVSRLWIYTPADDRLGSLAAPLGTIWSPASWVRDLIRFRFSAPSQPPTLATVQLATEPQWSLSPDHEFEGEPAWAQAELIDLEGPAGPIEAIVYGGPDWRARQHLLVALHGGPLASWRFEFDPLFQCLAAAGVAVVAPNYRGSTGYGDEHLREVMGNWGGPDLDDVLDLGRNLEQERRRLRLPRPVVLGVSYGAFLALLATCNEPELWAACVALAPFLSGPSLHKSACTAVRKRIEQLGGLKLINDTSGPRDVLQACASLVRPLLLIHGTRDETIPVEQSRALRQRLVELGKIEGIDFEYLEIDNGHEGVVLAWPRVVRQAVVRFCLARVGLEAQKVHNASHHGGRRKL